MKTPGPLVSDSPPAGDRPAVTPEIAAEAAVWVSRLHGPDRNSGMVEECLAWQRRSAAHQEAFESCTHTWQSVTRVTVAAAFSAASKSGSGGAWFGPRASPVQRAMAALAMLVVLGGGLAYALFEGDPSYATGVGEQQVVMLDDGTRVSLNTATRIRVRLGEAQRVVQVFTGEAIFEVARQPGRPFVVQASGNEVEAVGTVFIVRVGSPEAFAPESLAVTLIEGKVAVRRADAREGQESFGAVTLRPGQRLRLLGAPADAGAAPVASLDAPDLDQITAWKRSEAVFDGTLLRDAVAEMNRYSRTPIVLPGAPWVAELRVSGQYRTGDNRAFARAVAALHGLRVKESEGRLELAEPQ